MLQSAGHESRSVVDTGIGPVLTFALLSVKCTCMLFHQYVKISKGADKQSAGHNHGRQ
jgi:hypothetical protein